jgi:hypothetical protein
MATVLGALSRVQQQIQGREADLIGVAHASTEDRMQLGEVPSLTWREVSQPMSVPPWFGSFLRVGMLPRSSSPCRSGKSLDSPA